MNTPADDGCFGVQELHDVVGRTDGVEVIYGADIAGGRTMRGYVEGRLFV